MFVAKRWRHSLHPLAFAWETQVASVAGSMKPLLASTPDLAGLPMTSFDLSTPEAAISNMDDLGQVALDLLSRPSQVVYSVAPSAMV